MPWYLKKLQAAKGLPEDAHPANLSFLTIDERRHSPYCDANRQ